MFSRFVFSLIFMGLSSTQALAESASAFVKRGNEELKKLMEQSNRAEWIKETFITDDTELLAAAAATELSAFTTKLMREARRFDKAKVDADTRRQLNLFKISSDPGPRDPLKLKELSNIESKLSAIYGKMKICDTWTKQSSFDHNKDACLTLDELESLMAESSSAEDQRKAWLAWHTIGPEMRSLYQRFVKLSNLGAREAGFKDMGEVWKSRYEMSPKAFEAEMERLWLQVEPLYKDLHCYVNRSLARIYPGMTREDGKLPAELLGNMWAQDWSSLYKKLEPYPGESALDVTQALKDKEYDALKMVKLGESFFTSMGFAPLPQTFYERSMLTKPRDREVICHASAWDVSNNNDTRIKMCIQVNEENLITIHHELGHIFYYQSYHKLPVIYQQGAHDGFHEAIGDSIALSVNSRYLAQVGLIPKDDAEDKRSLINLQMKSALSKVAFLPFGYLMDKWRWSVFAGQTQAEAYNQYWWQLREHYQGIAAPESRPDSAFFDPGAKYHIPANVPYARYFLAHILQFQMFKALCEISGHQGPLATCSLYGQKAAGQRLMTLLSTGASKPWKESLKTLTGSEQMDAAALIEYFGPLHEWLKEQNQNQQCSWHPQK